jgi:nicotinamidase-related amidase
MKTHRQHQPPAIYVWPPLCPDKALVVIDVQNDFISGTLAVQTSEEIVAIINNMRDQFDCAARFYVYGCS